MERIVYSAPELHKSPLTKRIGRLVGKAINKLIPKTWNQIYVEPHRNGKTDKYDLINCNSDNALRLVNHVLRNETERDIVFVVEVYNRDRIEILEAYVTSINNPRIKVRFVESSWVNDGGSKNIDTIKRFIANSLTKYHSAVWMSDTGFAHFWDNVHGQTLISMNYGTQFKKGGIDYLDYTHNHFDYILETSLMTATVESSERHTDLHKILDIGFPRNDTLAGSDKGEALKDWLRAKNVLGKKIILYVPTFRDHDIDVTDVNILGLRDKGELSVILEKMDAVIITKLHPHQKVHKANYSDRIISYESSYDYSVYDLMSMTDVMITDYSTIASDFILAQKPIIYLFTDFDEYNTDRGFSFDPIQSVCYGDVVYEWEDFKNSLIDALSGTWFETEKMGMIRRMWYKYADFNATERSHQLLCEVLEKK